MVTNQVRPAPGGSWEAAVIANPSEVFLPFFCVHGSGGALGFDAVAPDKSFSLLS
jgi:hypothetical protein